MKASVGKSIGRIKIRDPLIDSLRQIIEMQANPDRIAKIISKKLSPSFNCMGKIPTRVFVPFIVELDIKEGSATLTCDYCFEDGTKAAEWLRDKILEVLK